MKRTKTGFTLLEVLVVLVVAAIIFGVSITLVSQGSRIATMNNAWSVVQRAVLATVEFLPKEISVATEVEIISRDNYTDVDIANGISEDWRYIRLYNEDHTVARIEELEADGSLKPKPLAGSSLITNLRFNAGGNKNPDDPRKLLYIQVEANSAADGKASDSDRTVSLDRTILTHTYDNIGVTGENGASIAADAAFSGGSILRYRM